MQEIEDVDRRKCFAVAILSTIWAGGKLPPSMVKLAQLIRRKMRKNGTWESA